MINVEQKAKDIVKKMYLVHSNSESAITHYFAKQCALVAVCEMMDIIEVNTHIDFSLYQQLEEVKEIIEKL